MLNTRIEVMEPSGKFHVAQREMPAVPENGLLLKAHFSGICHSDVHGWKSQWRMSDEVVLSVAQINPGHTWPYILGHEVAGEILGFGKAVDPTRCGLVKGDHVVLYAWTGCGKCSVCQSGDDPSCDVAFFHNYGVTSSRPGGFQAFVPVYNVGDVIKLPGGLPMDVGCLLGCSALTAFNACRKAQPSIEKALKMRGEAKLLIIGAGGLGQWAVGFAKAMFSKDVKVYAADLSVENLSLAQDRGCDGTVLWARGASVEEDLLKAKEVLGGDGGIAASLDFVGHAGTISRAAKLMKPSGTMVVIGMAGGTAQIAPLEMIFKAITLTTAKVGTQADLRELLEFIVAHKVEPPAITHVTPEGVNDVMKQLDAGTYKGRAVIKY